MEKVIIIGAGPAGISAALYAVRGNLDPLVINNGIGALEKAEKIENYYGLEHPLSGQELYDTGIAQAKALGVRILDAQVLGVGGFDTFVVKTTEGEFETQSLILATGSKRAAPKIPGVKEFEGKGVSYCAICDAFFYRGKDVAVLGNGDFAMHEAKELSNTASTVTIYTNGEEPEFTPEENISVNTMKIQSVEGDDLVSGIRLAPDVQAQEINGEAGQQVNDFCPADGVFIAMGTAGSTEIARQMGAELTEKGNIKVNENMETTIPGLYAAGETASGPHGADRLGGNMSVTCQVFGNIAGRSAAAYAKGLKAHPTGEASAREIARRLEQLTSGTRRECRDLLETLQERSDKALMIIRSQTGLQKYLTELADLKAEIARGGTAGCLGELVQLENLAEVGGLIARAALERKESRGSHYRADYPDADPALAHPIILEKA